MPTSMSRTSVWILNADDSEELQVSLGRLEQLHNKCANLRAEKKIWEVSTSLVNDCLPLKYLREFKVGLWKKTSHLLWKGHTCQTLRAICKRCTTTSRDLARTIGDVWKASYRRWNPSHALMD